MPMKNNIQLSMFSHEDLPLWSGAAPRVKDESFDPQPEAQQSTWAKCRFCADTGVLGDHAYCWCKAGEEAQR